MAESRYEICSRSSILVGGKPIGSFDDGTTESLVAKELWDPRVRELLVEHDWRFAQNLVMLAHLATPPLARWAHAWQLPADYLKLLSIEANGTLLRDFQINDDQLHCDLDQQNELILEYIRQVSENTFPPYFTAVLEERLSSDFAGVLREDAALAGFHRTQSNMKLLTAKRLDRLNQPARKFPVGRLRVVRR
jgi:hypothetical protein